MIYRPKVYTASKIYHSGMWNSFRQSHGEIEFTARWLDIPPGPDHESTFWTEDHKTLHWIQDIQDVQRSDFVLAYCGPDDDTRLSGTIAEVGAAIALGKVVLAVGFPSRHSWQAHPLVFSKDMIQDALNFAAGRV